MNNPNPFLPQSSFLEQKNKARARLRIAVLFSISLSVMVLVVLLVQGCRKNDTSTADNNSATSAPELANNNPAPDTNATATNVTAPPVAPEPNNPPTPPPPPTPAPAPEPTTTEYTIVKGDTFATIVKNYPGLSVKALEQANPTVNPRALRIGQKLHIPQVSATPVSAPAGAPEAGPVSGGEQTYKVKSGDNLTTIAKQFHTTIKAIQAANNMKTTSIRVGQTLKIPAKVGAEPAPAPETAPPPPVSTPTVPPPAMPEATSSNH